MASASSDSSAILQQQFHECPCFPGFSAEDNGVAVRFRGRDLPQNLCASGYLQVRIREHGEPQSPTVHQLVADAFLGPCPFGFQVDHINGNKLDNSAANLRYVTPSENRLNQKKSKNVVHVQCPVLRGEQWRLMNENWVKKASVSTLGRVRLANGRITTGTLRSGKRSFSTTFNYADGTQMTAQGRVDALVAKYFVPHDLSTLTQLEVHHFDDQKNNNEASNLIWTYSGETTGFRNWFRAADKRQKLAKAKAAQEARDNIV